MLLSICDWLLRLGWSYDLHVDCGKLVRGIAVERFWIVDLFVLKMFIAGWVMFVWLKRLKGKIFWLFISYKNK
jgi:hypothetical protein